MRCSASTSATKPPVIDAVRVPPSAWMTSQSIQIVRSPSSFSLVIDRSERPISRWISCVRPPTLPALASRCVRVEVARGSMPYSAVTQPLPVLRRNGGTRSSTLAVQITLGAADLDEDRAFGVGEKAGRDGRGAQIGGGTSVNASHAVTQSRLLASGCRRST